MYADIILTYEQINPLNLEGKICVVIDTLRATSTIVTALSVGCSRIIPVSSAAEALEMKKEPVFEDYLLGGEIEGQCIADFHLGNSPLEYSKLNFQGKGLILSTTNGTRTLQKVKNADSVLVCALLNVQAVVDSLAGQKSDIIICCAGTRGSFSLEDFLTAGRLVKGLKEGHNSISASDVAYTAQCFYEHATKCSSKSLANYFKYTSNGKRLLQAGLQADIDYCSQEDISRILPAYKNGAVTFLQSG